MSKKMKGPSKKITPREFEVLELVVLGYSSREIGDLLGISYRTVSVHRDRLMVKLEARNTADMVRIAIFKNLPKEYKHTKFSIKEEVWGK